jgi:hypothetical protein
MVYSKSKSEQMFQFILNAFKAAYYSKDTCCTYNDKRHKAHDSNAFDDEKFDEFNLDDNVSNKYEANTDSDE